MAKKILQLNRPKQVKEIQKNNNNEYSFLSFVSTYIYVLV